MRMSNLSLSLSLSFFLFLLDSQPTIAQLSLLKTTDGSIKIISRLAPHWRDLGIIMDFDRTGAEIETIEQKYRGDPKDCCRAMLQHWLNGNGKKTLLVGHSH